MPHRSIHVTNAGPRQFSLHTLLAVVAAVSLLLAFSRHVWLAIRLTPLTPHGRAISSVNNRDGWAREDADGYVIAELNGRSIAITNRSLIDLIPCERLRTLTAYKTQITDAGLVHLIGHKDLRTLYLDGSADISDSGIPHLVKLGGLKELSVNGTNISEHGVAVLRQSLPNCIVNPYGGN